MNVRAICTYNGMQDIQFAQRWDNLLRGALLGPKLT
jgi:hypothetical protein